jgi:hypothetical protein
METKLDYLKKYCNLNDEILSNITKMQTYKEVFEKHAKTLDIDDEAKSLLLKHAEKVFESIESDLNEPKYILERLNNTKYYQLVGEKRYREKQDEQKWKEEVSAQQSVYRNKKICRIICFHSFFFLVTGLLQKE